MKKFIVVINFILITTILLLFETAQIKTSKIKTDIDIKHVLSSSFKEIESQIAEDLVIDETDTKSNDKETTNIKESTSVGTQQEKITSETETIQEPVSDVLATMTGNMSGYGPDCSGCSGYTASGKYVGNGNITYYDNTYGNLRILSGDRSLQFGTVIRVNNSKAGTFTGIVLDRGGSIGIGKKYLFDLLYKTEKEALKDEVSYNATFEIIRYGY